MKHKLLSTAIAGCLGSSWLAGCEPGATESGSFGDAGKAYADDTEAGGRLSMSGVVVSQAESHATAIPFLTSGSKVKKGCQDTVRYTHGSLAKSVEKLFGLPFSSTVSTATDFTDLFVSGGFTN